VREGYSQIVNRAPAPTAAQTAAAKPQPEDPLGRDSPRGCVLGFLKAIDRGALSQAAEYLDARAKPTEAQKLAQQLAVVLNQGSSVNIEALSRAPEGSTKDAERTTRELIGSLQTTSGKLDILLDRVTRGNQPPIWLFSFDTLRNVPRAYQEIHGTGIARFLPRALVNIKVFSIDWWRWLILVLLAPLAFLLGSLVTYVLRPLLRLTLGRITGEEANHHIPSLVKPIRLLLLALAGLYISRWGISVLSRTVWASIFSVLAVVSLTWMLIVCSDIASDLQLRRLVRDHATDRIAVLALGRRIFKILIVFVGVVFLLHRAGLNVSAVLAGLGIGGIALALGAQKTFEDVLGGIAIISRRAARVGDFCQVAGAAGTIEDIGLSAMRIRTLDRTVIYMPNGKISQMNLENCSMRDKNWFHHRFGLRYDTSPEVLRSILDQVNWMLRQDPRVETETAR